MSEVKNPYGGGPGTGISLPSYYKPTKYLKNNNFFFPGLEEVGPDEMRISFVGSCPWPSRRNQAGTSIMVELGYIILNFGNKNIYTLSVLSG